ncbi:MAG TPA: hypothetical protein VGZ02_10455 [Candidatus Baltobacteraceae bacterium]|jgi:YVTN family beta-propeller protein|nr:hypothetical protein [Candidatus Baltobacteraceae bacterium]
MRLFALAALALFATAAAPPPPAAPAYHLIRRYVLGGDGGWDYLTFDPQRKRVFISRSTRVMVVDASNGELAGTIANTPGVHGIALAPDLGKGFTSNGRDGTVTVFDLNTLQKLATIQTGAKNPDCIVYDPATKRVFTFNGGSDDATAIDAATNAVIATIPLGGRPEFAVADGKGRIYDNLEDKSAMAVIDAQKAAVVTTWPMDPCRSPSGLSMDRQNRVLFAACDGQMAMIDADGGKTIATVPTGKGTDATAFYPGENLAFAPNGRDATLTVVASSALKRFSVLENVKTELGARTMALDPSNGEVYLVTAQLQVNPNATSYRERYHAVPGTFALLVLAP